MKRYTLIASRDLFTSRDAEQYCRLAADLKAAGNEVTFFLVQNAVLGARKSAVSDHLSDLAKSGVTVLADSFSLRERGVGSDRLVSGVKASELDVVVDHMAEGRNVIWH